MAQQETGRQETGRRSQQDRSATTRSELVRVARRLFAERGYAQVPAEEIVAAAGLTRGALYHHFQDKTELFRAVFEEVESEVTAQVAAAAAAQPVPEARMRAALGRFLDLCQTPEVLRIALTDAPAVLGWQAWREIEARHGLGLIAGMLAESAPRGPVPTQRVAAQGIAAQRIAGQGVAARSVAGQGVAGQGVPAHGDGGPPPVPLLAQLVLSAVIEAALQIAHATDPRAARQEAEHSLLILLGGLLPAPGAT